MVGQGDVRVGVEEHGCIALGEVKTLSWRKWLHLEKWKGWLGGRGLHLRGGNVGLEEGAALGEVKMLAWKEGKYTWGSGKIGLEEGGPAWRRVKLHLKGGPAVGVGPRERKVWWQGRDGLNPARVQIATNTDPAKQNCVDDNKRLSRSFALD